MTFDRYTYSLQSFNNKIQNAYTTKKTIFCIKICLIVCLYNVIYLPVVIQTNRNPKMHLKREHYISERYVVAKLLQLQR